MSAKTGLSLCVAAWVAENQGAFGRDIGAALGFNHNNGLLSYMVKRGLLLRSGPVKLGCYYTDSDLAQADHDRLLEAAKARTLAKKRAYWAAQNKARLAERHARAAAVQAAKLARLEKQKAETVAKHAARRAVLDRARELVGHCEVYRARVTIAPTPPPRFAPDPGYVGQFVAEWRAKRAQQETA